MIIVIPVEGRVRTVIRSSFVSAKRETETTWSLTGEVFQMTGVTADQVLILPDTVMVTEGQEITGDLKKAALPIESLLTMTADEALPNVLGLLLRIAIADGRLTDEELLSVKPALEDRVWRVGLNVQVGDVYSYGGSLYRCILAHTTQGTWAPDVTPTLWKKIEIVPEDGVRVWEAGIDYVLGDVVAYPDAASPQYECQMAHTSQVGWEPPNVPALWRNASGSVDELEEAPSEEEITEETT